MMSRQPVPASNATIPEWDDPAWTRRGHEGTPETTLRVTDPRARRLLRQGKAVRVDRQTRWGNPFRLANPRDPVARRGVIERYRDQLAARVRHGLISLDDLARLHGKYRLCHCAPEPCHADVLGAAAAWAAGKVARAAA